MRLHNEITINFLFSSDVDVVEIITTTAAAAAAAAATAAATAGGSSGLGSMAGMTAGQAPSGLPQPGTGNLKQLVLYRSLLRKHFIITQKRNTMLLDIIVQFISHLVGGGAIFTPGSAAAGSAQALATALVPPGLTPIAFFAPTATQQFPALSAIFLELPVSGKKRRKRYLKHRYSDDYYSYNNNLPESIFTYYKRNLQRFTRLVQRGDVNRLLRPGKFSTDPPNNLELILRYKNSHFEGMINSTKNT